MKKGSKQTDTKKATAPKNNGGNAITAAALGRSATAQVARHSGSDLAGTGTNISYEGATAPGAGGSVGTGYASGKDAVDAEITTTNDIEDQAPAKAAKGKKKH